VVTRSEIICKISAHWLAGTGAVLGGMGGDAGGSVAEGALVGARLAVTGMSWARWPSGWRAQAPLAILGDGAPALRTSELCCSTCLLEGFVQSSTLNNIGALMPTQRHRSA